MNPSNRVLLILAAPVLLILAVTVFHRDDGELAEVITSWPMLSADLPQAILAIVRSADVMAEASLAATE